MTDTNTASEAEAAQEAPVAVSKVPANPALISWPRDQWGMCVDLRKALVEAARNVRGNDEKMEVFMSTLKVGIQHAMARLGSDKEALVAAIAAEEEAIARRNQTGRVAGYSVPIDVA
jgi:hypothetical protein